MNRVQNALRSAAQGLHRFRVFATRDVWDVDLNGLSFLNRIRIRSVRFVHLIVRGFRDDNLTLHASALTYTTLISLVPFLAFLISIMNGFGGGEKALIWVHTWAADMPEGIQTFVDQLLDIVENTNFLALGGSAMAFLFFTVIKMLGSIEASFNQVWGVASDRSTFRKITDYISTLVVVLLFILSAATLSLDALFAKLGIFSFVADGASRLLPLVSTWIAFSFLYAFMPNTRVKMLPTILSGLIGAVLWMTWVRFFSWAQVGVFRYNQIFGTFAAIPIFLFWLYVCWVIVLIGVESAFALQNTGTFEKETTARQASVEARLKLALGIIARTAAALDHGEPRFNREAYAREHGISIRLINRVLRLLQRRDLLVEVRDADGDYVLAQAADRITVDDVIEAVFQDGVRPETLGVHVLESSVENAMSRIHSVLMESFGSLTFEQLVMSDWATANPDGPEEPSPVSDGTE